MPFLVAEILNFQGSAHHVGVGSLRYIYMGGQQQVTLDVFSNCIPARFTLQPFVYRTLDYYKPKIEKYIEKMEKRASRIKDV